MPRSRSPSIELSAAARRRCKNSTSLPGACRLEAFIQRSPECRPKHSEYARQRSQMSRDEECRRYVSDDQRDGCCNRCVCQPKHADDDNTGDDVDGRAQDQPQVRMQRVRSSSGRTTRPLIQEMSIAVPLWGATRVHGVAKGIALVRSNQPSTFSLPAHGQCRESGSIVD